MNWTEQLNRKFDERSDEGQALAEYALIIGAIAIFAIGSLTLLGQNVNDVLALVASRFGGIP